MENLNKFKSHDFYISACILASGVPLVGLVKEKGDFVTFVFGISQNEAEKIVSDHWNRQLRIPSRNLIEAINELKTRLHSGI